MTSFDKVVTAIEAARLVGLSGSTLAKLRLNGNGPTYCKLGRRVVYRPADLEEWLRSGRRATPPMRTLDFLSRSLLSAPGAEMGCRYPNARLAKIHRTYSVDELSRLLKIHKNTVRNWLRQGLKAIDGLRPILITGEELRRFLANRRAKSKQACGPGRIYCLPCRAPKVPAGKIADCIQSSETSGTLAGICPDCGRMIYRRVNPQKLEAVRGDLAVMSTRLGTRIEDTANPNVNCDFIEDDQK